MPSHILAYRALGNANASSSAWVLHGLLGNARNWSTFGTKLVQTGPGFQFRLLDIRNHGASSKFSSPNTLSACVQDLVNLGNAAHPWPCALVGHSLGGKILLQLASDPHAASVFTSHRQHKDNLRMFIIDSLPGSMTDAQRLAAHGRDRDSVSRVLELVQSMPLPIHSRRSVHDVFIQAGMPEKLAQWMASNVKHNEDGQPGMRWLFDPAAAIELYQSHMATDRWDVLLNGPPPGIDVDLIMATRSSRWHDAETKDKLARVVDNQKRRHASSSGLPSSRGRVRLHEVQGGHWLHVDNPDGLLATMAGYFGGSNKNP